MFEGAEDKWEETWVWSRNGEHYMSFIDVAFLILCYNFSVRYNFQHYFRIS